MNAAIDYDELDASLRNCGSSWNAGQTHGMLCGQLAVLGAAGGASWLGAVLENTDPNDAQRNDCEAILDQLYAQSYRQLAERLSEFAPLLPQGGASTAAKTEAMGQWCEGFLHGLVATASSESLKKKLAAEPLSEIIKDLLQISRATFDDAAEEEDEDQAYEELYEYIRVAAQLVYEELDEFRNPTSESRSNDAADSVLH